MLNTLKTPLLRVLRPLLRPARPDAPQGETPVPSVSATPVPADALQIPIRDQCPGFEGRQSHQRRGQFLARQDRWEELSDLIRTAEAQRDTTRDGMPVADLLGYGARLDLICAVEDGLQDGAVPDSAQLEIGLAALETVLTEFPDSYPIALIVALTHIDLAWAWRAASPSQMMPPAHRAAFCRHFERAAEILDGFCPFETGSPGLAAARCALLPSLDQPVGRIADDYEDLIELDPHNYRHMRAMGNHLLPRWFGSYRMLDLEARRTAARTHDIWGHAAYTWVYFDALAQDDLAFANVDADYFIDGLHDIMSRHPDQCMVNMLAAYCAVTLAPSASHSDFEARSRISACAGWIVRDHLTELYPMVWAHAAAGFDNNLRVGSVTRFSARGRDHALRVLGDLFRDEIAGGARIAFTPDGLRVSG